MDVAIVSRCPALLALLLALLVILPLQARGSRPSATGSGPPPSAQPIGASRQITPQVGDRCPICAMPAADHPKTSAAIEALDGRTWYFCGNGCTIRCWLAPQKCLGVDKKVLRRALVREWFGGDALDAGLAFWVAGWDVVGPMGKMVVPLASQEQAEVFMIRHSGTRVFRLAELDEQSWAEIRKSP